MVKQIQEGGKLRKKKDRAESHNFRMAIREFNFIID